uniref:COX6C domain-containing protein n=1 Tax=Angiostrongylus cantonensis TaxID=6313 RepID=A0A0K0D9N6_ANGCA
MGHPFVMRGMSHSYARKGLAFAFITAVSSTVAFNVFYVWPRYRKYEEFFKNYDPYLRMKEICAEGTGYMHTCPKDLAKMYEEKGKKIAPL